MTDRVKYFVLGLLFLVVAGVIAFDRWSSRDAILGSSDENSQSARDDANSGEIWVRPPADPSKRSPLIIEPGPDDPELPIRNKKKPKVFPQPNPAPGPIPGPNPVVRPTPSPTSAKMHVVKSGETLEAISRQYYPGKVYAGVKLIASANKIENLNRIKERQKLIIPAMNTQGNRKPIAPVVDRSTTVPSTYTVKASDGDLYSICRRYYGRKGEGRRIKEIMALNNLWSANVSAGTTLKLPPR